MLCYLYRRVGETTVKKEDEDSGGTGKAMGETSEASNMEKGL